MTYHENEWPALFIEKADFNKEHLQALREQRVSCIVIDDFYPSDACAKIAQAVEQVGFKYSFKAVNVEAYYSGRAAIELAAEKKNYFDGVAEANQQRQQYIGSATDPLEMVIALLQQGWKPGAEIALEGGRPYFAGVIRIFKNGVVHNDYAPRDMVGWTIADINQQLSWNLFLQSPEGGGEFQIWKRYWIPEDEKLYKHDPKTMKGYKDEVVNGCATAVVDPQTGRFVLFDARNYHTIGNVVGNRDRIAMSSFIGIVDESKPLIFWS